MPTLRRYQSLRLALDHLDAQTTDPDRFEVVVVHDATEPAPAVVREAVGSRRYAVSVHAGERPGASSARNVGLGAVRAPLVLFLDDDILAGPRLVEEHLASHDKQADDHVGVLGSVSWAQQARVTPFMRWLENGLQFDYGTIRGSDAQWWHFYTANASASRALLQRAGGFDATGLPFGYEDLDLAYRMHEHGFRLVYNPAAAAEHLHHQTLQEWRRRVVRIADAERAFLTKHPHHPAYFHNLFSQAAAAPRARGLAGRLWGVVPRGVPWLGPRVWHSADIWHRQQLADRFLAAWDEDGDALATSGPASARDQDARP